MYDIPTEPNASDAGNPVELGVLTRRQVRFPPGLFKTFDEIIVNAADNRQRDENTTRIVVVICTKGGCKMPCGKVADGPFVSIMNNGNGIPVRIHKEHDMYVPELVFGHLLTSSNYDDSKERTTGGRNGYGAKLTNIFSTMFRVETADGEHKFVQVFRNNMSDRTKPKITKFSGKSFTRITYTPDFPKFGIEGFTHDIVCVLAKRVIDLAACLGRGGIYGERGVNVSLKIDELKIKLPKTFRQYTEMVYRGSITESDSEDDGEGSSAASKKKRKSIPIVYTTLGEHWEIAAFETDGNPETVSFVNCISTHLGGTHARLVRSQISRMLATDINESGSKGKAKKDTPGKPKPKKTAPSKSGVAVKHRHVDNHLGIVINSLIPNPTFSSQIKSTLTTPMNKIRPYPCIPASFIAELKRKTGIVRQVQSFTRYKESRRLERQTNGSRTRRVLGIPKLSDAYYAGTDRSSKCTLILTEGDSAKSLALAGLQVVGCQYYGVYPLKGKVLNVREVSDIRVQQNKEIVALKKIIGLEQRRAYGPKNRLRYGRVMIMADQDVDGSHIKGLVINVFHHFWPSLITRVPGFLSEFITPIVKCKKGHRMVQFFSLPQYEAWKSANDEGRGWKVKYYKGLGTSSAAEGKEYFSDLKRHVIDFKYTGDVDDRALNMAFGKGKNAADKRKRWIQGYVAGTCLDQENISSLSYSRFVHEELILFSMESNTRAIPSIVDGLKPSQRKILFTVLDKNITTEMRVSALQGIVSSHSAYHHGDASLNETIVKMAQAFTGSGNNIRLLQGIGQFGTRREGGKDSASPRYINTMATPIARILFPMLDDAALKYNVDDGQTIEPEYYCPIIPMILVNGARGVGNGFSTFLPPHHPLEVCDMIETWIDRKVSMGETKGSAPRPVLQDIRPHYVGFKGSIEAVRTRVGGRCRRSYFTNGVYHVLPAGSSSCEINITELPVGVWTTAYKTFLETLKYNEREVFSDIKEEHGEDTVSFTVRFRDADLMRQWIEEDVIREKLKLRSTRPFSMENMWLYDASGRLRKYQSSLDIARSFCTVRYSFYQKRKMNILEAKRRKAKLLENKARFVALIIQPGDSSFRIQGREISDIVQDLQDMKFASLPGHTSRDSDDPGGFGYLLKMPLMKLTLERYTTMRQNLQRVRDAITTIENTSEFAMWKEDLAKFRREYAVHAKNRIPTDTQSSRKRNRPKSG